MLTNDNLFTKIVKMTKNALKINKLSTGSSVLLLLLCYVNVPYLKKNVINNFLLYNYIKQLYMGMDIQWVDKRMKNCHPCLTSLISIFDPYLRIIHLTSFISTIHLFRIEWIGYPLNAGGVAIPSCILNTCMV